MKILHSLLLILLFPAIAISADGRAVTYDVQGEPFEGYYISPSADAPLILLFHDWDGLTDYEVKRSRMLADLGYAVFAADLFGAGIRPDKIEDRRQHTGELYKDRARMRRLMDGAVDAARSEGANVDHAVVMGYCFGGAAVLELARSGADFKGFVTFHGGLATPEGQDYSNTKGKLLILHGTADTAITIQDFSKLASELEENNIPHEMITYGGAPHAFTVFGTDRYRQNADENSWWRFRIFLKEVL